MDSIEVDPIKTSGKVEHAKVKVPPDNKNTLEDETRVLEESMSENPDYSSIQREPDEELCKDGLSRRDYVRLKQGKFARQNETFIRGYTVAKANGIVEKFLQDSINSGYRCVKIVHGKGLNSPDGVSKLKLRTQRLLTLNKFVLAYCNALPADGGSGAKYVLLKKRR